MTHRLLENAAMPAFRLTRTAPAALLLAAGAAFAQAPATPAPAGSTTPAPATPATPAAPATQPAPATTSTPAPVAAPATSAGLFSVTVTRDDLPLRSGPATLHYPVANLKAGTVLRVDGDESGYFRVAYPAGLRAFVRAEELTVDASGKTAKLQRPSRLRAVNMTAGDRGSWYPLLERDLPAGTELTVLDTIKGEDGKPVMFAVAAPDQARGFVLKDFVRRLSDAEAGAAPATASSTPAPAGRLVPVDGGTGTPSTQTMPNVIGSQPTTITMQPDGAASAPAATPAPAAPAQPSPAQALIMLYRRVQAEPIETAELDEAIRQFDTYLTTANPGDRSTRQLMSMLDVLRLRRDARDQVRKSQATSTELAQQQASLTQQIAELERQAVYRAIGRVMPSLVFNGDDLPRLYRIVSPEPGTARTIGYVAEAPGLDLAGKVNRIVGIVGDARLDEALRANIITPVRIDVLNIQPAVSSPATPGGTVLPTPTTPTTPPAGN
jgi:uncharacterized protein YgiM (DUF1202 family)